ncbi:MAG: hypothetical protein N2688_00095 [Burkholderiaceae bacterium]|nr:hypothetical protein [Burkholderiaceae bacterium]
MRLQRDLFDHGVQVRSCGTGNQKRLGPWGPLHSTDFAVTVVIGRHVAIVSSTGAPPSVMPDAMIRELVAAMALKALDDLKGRAA